MAEPQNTPVEDERDAGSGDSRDLQLSEPLVESSIVNSVPVHVPGMALETASDREAREQFEADKEASDPGLDPLSLVVEYDGIDTRNPDANYETRSNIVRPDSLEGMTVIERAVRLAESEPAPADED
jgi:hypothetical protein